MSDHQLGEAAVARTAIAKASWRILPLLGLGYLVSYLDRLNVSFAAPQMNADLGFSAAVYGLGGGLFFLSYALFEIPSGMLVARVGARRWIARIMITWGLLAAAMMFVRTPVQFYIMRFLLGIAEAGFFPCALYCLSHWFPAAHRGRATSRFYAFGGVASIIMGIVSGWLLDLDGLWDLRGWQWLFLVEGLPAVLLGLVILRMLPDAPSSSRWLSEPERAWIESQLARDAAQHGASEEHHVLTALRIPLVLKLAIIGFLTIGSWVTFQLFQPSLLADATGLDLKHVGYLVSGGGLLSLLGMLASGWHSDRLGQRYSHLLGGSLLVAGCFLTMGLATSPKVLLGAYMVVCFCWPAVTLSTALSCSEGVPKHMVAVAMGAVNTLSQLGAFIGPWMWGISKDVTGTYHLGLMLLPVAFLLAAGATLSLGRRLTEKAPQVV